MNRLELRAALASLDLTERPAEAPHRAAMLHLLDTEPRCFERDLYTPGHFTGSALVVSADGARALLHHHRKLDKWLQFGGHYDGEEDVLRVACREAEEESGITGLIVASHKPFDVDVHSIPARAAEPEHAHFDVRYMLIAPEGAQAMVSPESHELRWFTPEELRSLPLDASLCRLVDKWQAIVARRTHS